MSCESVNFSDNLPHIVIIGGGTGASTLLEELKYVTPNLSEIVNMSDDGGSTGILRRELGVAPMGDLRQGLLALSDEGHEDARERYRRRRPDGHSEGNLRLAELQIEHGCIEKAISIASQELGVRGNVIPVTTQDHTLVMQDGPELIRGEYIIGHRAIQNPDAYVFHDPPVSLNPRAHAAIEAADLVVIAPGNVYGSLLPTLVVGGMRQALAKARAPKIAIANLMTTPGQTDGWHAVDFAYQRQLGQVVDTVLYNNALPDRELVDQFAADGEEPVGIEPERFMESQAHFIGASLVANTVYKQDKHDTLLRRTAIRHDAQKVGKELLKICLENRLVANDMAGQVTVE